MILAYARPMPNESHAVQDLPTDARDAAYRILVLHAGAFPDLLPLAPETSHLDPRDQGLAQTIVREGVVRWLTLTHVIESLSDRKLGSIEPAMRAVLIGGAAQLLFLDRVPPHAVIDESVEWAKRSIRRGAGGMVNAILRKVARARTERDPSDPDAIPLANGAMRGVEGVEWPEDPITRLSKLYSLPKQTLRRWMTHDSGSIGALASHSIVRAPVLVTCDDWSKVGDSDLLTPHQSDTHRVFEGSQSELVTLLEAHPTLRVQDPSSASVVGGLPDLSGGVVVDLCAGQGTKTRQLRSKYPNATIFACEVDDSRLRSLEKVFSGDEQVRVIHAGRLAQALGDDRASLVLTDVPCSNTGVLARRAEARYRGMTDQLSRLVELQRQIIDNACSLVRPGGVLAYSTCSIEREENEDRIQEVLDRPNTTRVHEHRVAPNGLPGDPPSVYHDGSYCGVVRLDGNG